MGAYKKANKATRMERAEAETRQLKKVLNQVAAMLRKQKEALLVLATGVNWTLDLAKNVVWFGEGNPQEIAREGLEPPKPLPEKDHTCEPKPDGTVDCDYEEVER